MRIDVQTEAISQDLISKVVHVSRSISAILLPDFWTVDDERTEVLSLFYFFMLMCNTLKCKGGMIIFYVYLSLFILNSWRFTET